VNFFYNQPYLDTYAVAQVGHSIGAYIALEIFKKFPSQVGCGFALQGTFRAGNLLLFRSNMSILMMKRLPWALQ